MDASRSPLGDAEVDVIPILGLDGRAFLNARVPHIDRGFHSGLHSMANQRAQLGSWRGELEALLARRAPTAQLVTDANHLMVDSPADSTAIASAIRHALAEGFVGGYYLDVDGEAHGYLAAPDRIDTTIDLAALEADYRAWFAALDLLQTVPEWDDRRVDQLVDFAIDELRDSTYGQLLWHLDQYSTFRVDTGIIHGIVTGADPAMTCAFLLKQLTGDARWWQPVG